MICGIQKHKEEVGYVTNAIHNTLIGYTLRKKSGKNCGINFLINSDSDFA